MSSSKESLDYAFKKAVEVRSRAHAPYSKFQVGAALKVKGHDELTVGCNVENASYGGTICAERSAVVQAVSKYGKFEPEYLVLVTGSQTPDSPCGFCLQVLSEFVGPDFQIHLSTLNGIQKTVQFKELMPRPFDNSNLPSQK